MSAGLEQAFLATLQGDENPQLTQRIYADWLEEQGDPGTLVMRYAATVRDYPRDTWVPFVDGDSPCQQLWEQVWRLIACGQWDADRVPHWASLARLPDGWKDVKGRLWKWDEPGARDESGVVMIKKLGLDCSPGLEHRVLNTLETAADPKPIQTWYARWLEPHDGLRASLLRQAVTIRNFPQGEWVELINGNSLCSVLWDEVVSYLSRKQVRFDDFYQWARRARIPNGWREQEQSVWKWNELEMSGYD